MRYLDVTKDQGRRTANLLAGKGKPEKKRAREQSPQACPSRLDTSMALVEEEDLWKKMRGIWWQHGKMLESGSVTVEERQTKVSTPKKTIVTQSRKIEVEVRKE